MGRNLKLYLICIIGLTWSLYLYFYLLLPQIVPWDEANHLYWGWRFFSNLSSGDFHALWETIRTQWNYPPLQSIITGLFSFLTGGFSIEKARVLSIVWFWGSAILLWKIGEGLISKSLTLPKVLKSFRIEQILPVILFLTSPLMLFFASNHMKEMMGVFLTLLTIYFYFRSFPSNSLGTTEYEGIGGIGPTSLKLRGVKGIGEKRYLFWAGIALLLTTFEKYNFGILIGMAIGIEEVIQTIARISKSPTLPKVLPPSSRSWRDFGGTSRLLKEMIIKNLYIFGPTVVVFFFWTVWPKNQFFTIINWLKNDVYIYSLYDTTTFGHFFFFPLEFISSYSFSYLIGILGLLGVLGVLGPPSLKLRGVKRLHDFRVRLLLFFFLFNLVIGTRQFMNQQARYFITSVPALFLLIGVGTEEFLSHLGYLRFLGHLKKNGFVLGLFGGLGMLGGGLILLELIRLPFMVRPTTTHAHLYAVYGEKDYRDSMFYYNKFAWPHVYQGNMFIKQMEVASFIVRSVDLTKPVYFFGRTNEFSPPFFDLMFMIEKKRLGNLGEVGGLGERFNEYFIVMEVQPGGILDTGDYKKMNRDFSISEIARFREASGTTLLSSQFYKEFGLTVEIWGR